MVSHAGLVPFAESAVPWFSCSVSSRTEEKEHGQSIDLGFFFFGLYCVSLGYLLLRSTFPQRMLGALLVLAGLG